ncbi:MAG TPA: oligosaccharide flippase family protein [Candidatus Krumholzibacteria bacterium]
MGAGVVWNLGSAALPLLGSFAVSILLAPYLGPAEFGRYMTTMSAATFALIAAKMGVHAATSRLLSESPGNERVWLRAGLLLRAAATLPVALLCMWMAGGIALRLDGEALVPSFRWLPAIVITTSFYEMGGESLIGLGRFRSLLLNRTAALALRLGAVFWVRVQQLSGAAFLAGHALSQAIPAVFLLLPLSLHLPTTADAPRLDEAVRKSWRIAFPLALSSASYLIYSHTDRLMLAYFHDTSLVGQFAVARNVLDALLFPLFALSWSLRPALVRSWQRVAQRNAILSDGLGLCVHFALSAGALLFVCVPALLVALYGPDYTDAGGLIVWMIPLLLLRALGAPLFPALLAADRQVGYARLMLFTAVLNVVANLLLIPRYGAVGAIVGTWIALLPLTVGGWLQLLRAQGVRLGLGRPVLGSLLLALFILLLRPWLTPDGAGLPRLLVGATLAGAFVALPLLRPRQWGE